jgi:hypothetical protein
MEINNNDIQVQVQVLLQDIEIFTGRSITKNKNND